ncbi:MAG: right-handed parallel beta-helix repeat-containing protein [Planctomycetota bacterium]|nr:right-handed parallel beta-helix repeat-containing protein [Planctomycetota bacterium]
MIQLRHHYYEQFNADYKRDVPAEGYGGWKSGSITLDPRRTALVVMHAWDCGTLQQFPGWYSACDEIPRTYEVCRKVFPPLLKAVRGSGMSLFHIVAEGAPYFRNLPGYHRAVALAQAATLDTFPGGVPSGVGGSGSAGGSGVPASLRAQPDPASQAIHAFRGDHVFPGKQNTADINAGWPTVDFPAEARPVGDEGVAENTLQLAALARDAGVNHLVYVGFNIDWCLLMSPGGMLDLQRLGYVCSTIRQAVTAVENAETARRELCKEIGLWRVSVNFGCVFDADDFAAAVTPLKVERPATPAAPDGREKISRSVAVAPKDFILPPKPTWHEANGNIYGAKPDAQGPLGGGRGYANTKSTGDIVAATTDQVIAALAVAKPGQTVFIPGDLEIDFTDRAFTDAPFALRVPAGVTLASDRGLNGSPGALLYSDAFQTSPLIESLGPAIRVTGLRLRGPDGQRRLAFHRRVFVETKYPDDDGHKAYYSFPNSDGVVTRHDNCEVDNCEIFAWSHGGVFLCGGAGNHIHHCHIHHQQRMGLGYGICVHMDSKVVIDHCIFQDNKHNIASSGMPGVGYEAAHNLVLALTRTHLDNSGNVYGQDHLFDMHGGRDRNDGTDIAGSYLRVHHNTFASLYLALCIRGVPQKAADVYRNWFYAPAPGPDVVDTGGSTHVIDNAYGPPPGTRTGLDPGTLPEGA